LSGKEWFDLAIITVLDWRSSFFYD